MWRTFFDDNHADLVIVAEMLLRCHLSPERILRKALSGVENSPCEVTFEQAICAVIDATLEHNRGIANTPTQAGTPPLIKLRVPGISQIARLPWPERAYVQIESSTLVCGKAHPPRNYDSIPVTDRVSSLSSPQTLRSTTVDTLMSIRGCRRNIITSPISAERSNTGSACPRRTTRDALPTSRLCRLMS